MDSRPLTLEDAPAATALCNRYESYWNTPLITPEDQMRDELTDPSVDLESDTIGVWADNELVAYGIVWHRPSGERLERAYLFGHVDPDYRGLGIGREVLGFELERATEILQAIDSDLPKYIRVDHWDWIDEAHRLYRRMGFEPVRYFKDMIRPLDGPMTVGTAEGFSLVPMDRNQDDAVRHTWNESFADHWGTTPIDPASYTHRIEMTGTRVDLSLLAMEGDEVVGLCLNAHYPDDQAVTGRHEGWIEVLGVRSDWRGKGLASALIEASCNNFYAEGMTHAALNVDSANQTGAFGLYERLGFEPTVGTITSEIQVGG